MGKWDVQPNSKRQKKKEATTLGIGQLNKNSSAIPISRTKQ